MGKKPDIPTLRRLVEFMDRVETTSSGQTGYERAKLTTAKALATIEDVVASDGARYRQSGAGYSLRLAGVNTSCTSGPAGLLRNWRNAAERRISQAEGA